MAAQKVVTWREMVKYLPLWGNVINLRILL